MADATSKVGRIGEILQETIYSIEHSKEEITEIVEYAKRDIKQIEIELVEIKDKVAAIIKEVDHLEVNERRSRAHLSNVSKNFDIYTEDDIKEAYDKSNEIRIQLLLKREEEKTLLARRNEYELRLKSALEVYEKAGNVKKSISVVNEYLKGNLDEILFTVEHLNKKQVLGIKIIEAQEEERERLARDIHDGPAQSMVNILVKTEICERLIDIDTEKSKDELRDLKNIVRVTLNDLRKTIYNLRPMSLDDLGLIPTIERYIYNYIDYTGIDVKLNVLGNVIELNSAVETAIFRIIQESLNNIFKHSKATEAKIVIEYSPSRLNLAINDNGVGFDVEEINRNGSGAVGGFGLISIKERIELLEGDVEIKSMPGKGTRIHAHIRLAREENENEMR